MDPPSYQERKRKQFICYYFFSHSTFLIKQQYIEKTKKWTEVDDENYFSASVVDVFCMMTEPMKFVRGLSFLDTAVQEGSKDKNTYVKQYGVKVHKIHKRQETESTL